MSTELWSILLDWIFISSCRKLSSGLCHNSNNTQWWLGFLFLRGETESVLRVISSSRNGSELKRPMAHKVCKRTKIHIRDCKSYPTKDWCVSMVAKKVAAQTYCHSWGSYFYEAKLKVFGQSYSSSREDTYPISQINVWDHLFFDIINGGQKSSSSNLLSFMGFPIFTRPNSKFLAKAIAATEKIPIQSSK